MAPGLVTVKVPVMLNPGKGALPATGSFFLGPATVTSPVCAPPRATLPVGVMMSAGSARAVGLFAAGVTTLYVTVTVSPTLGLGLSTVMIAVVVPSIGGMPAIAGGMQCVAKSTFWESAAAAPAGAASAPPAVTASAVTPSSAAQRRLRACEPLVPLCVAMCPLLRDAGAAARLRRQGAIDVRVV